jgi:hypothetical protein
MKEKKTHSRIPWNKGKKLGFIPSAAFKKGQRASMKTEFKKGGVPFIKGKTHTKESREKMIQSHTGVPLSIETRKKMSEARMGRKTPEETKKKLREAHLKLWDKKGRNPQNRDKHVGSDYELWRTKVFQRDNWTCHTCRKVGGYLEAHHIKSWRNYPSMRFSVENGITLCKNPCHRLANTEQRRLEKVVSI